MNLKIEKYMIEIWKTPINKGEIYDNYQVSNLGRLMSLNYRGTGRAKLRKLNERKDGYLEVALSKNGKEDLILVHRLVAETFIPNPDNLPEVNHKDEDKTNNFVFLNEDGSVDKEKSNLEWKSHKGNCNHGTRNQRVIKANTNGKCSKKVLQFTLDGKFVREWPSTKEAERNGYTSCLVAACCRGEQKTHKGFKWQYA